MRRLPIDTSLFTLTVAEEPREVQDYETKERKFIDGAPVSSLRLLIQTPSEMSIVSVKTAGLVGDYKVNDPVRVTGLTASMWSDNGKPAWSFFAEGVELVTKAKAA
jgi:hypothetical protein